MSTTANSSINGNTGATTGAPVITTVTNTKVNTEAQYQTLVNGILANLGNETSFPMGGQSYPREDLIAQFQQRIAAAEKTKASKNLWHADVQSERKVVAAVAPLRKAMQKYLQGRYGDGSTKLGEFGFKPVKPRKVSAKTKATSAVKAEATKVARNTVGKNQRKAVKAPPPTSPVASSSTATTGSPVAPATGAHPTTGGAT
jgi:hypothetical protein